MKGAGGTYDPKKESWILKHSDTNESLSSKKKYNKANVFAN